MTFDEYNNKKQEDYNKFSKGKIFYAFNTEQFKKGMKSIIKTKIKLHWRLNP